MGYVYLYCAPGRVAEYYDERVCLSVSLCLWVCLSVRDHIFGTTRPILANASYLMALGDRQTGKSSRPSGQQLRTPDGRKCWTWGICGWTTCPRLLPESGTAEIRTREILSGRREGGANVWTRTLFDAPVRQLPRCRNGDNSRWRLVTLAS